MKPRLRDRVLIVGFVLALALPGTATFLNDQPLTVEFEPVSNLKPLRLRDLADARTYEQVDDYLDDRFPLDAVAVTARALVTYGVFNSSPSPLAIPGRDGWLYYRDEVIPRCPFDAAQVLQKVDDLAVDFGNLGKGFQFVVVPNKRTIYPEPIAGTWAGEPNCADAERAALVAGLASRSPIGLDLFTPLRAARESGTEATGDLFWHTDTHWTTAGMLVAARPLVAAYPEVTWDASVVDQGEMTILGDLYRIMGLLITRESGQRLAIDRGVTSSEVPLPVEDLPSTTRPALRFSVSGPAPVVPGTTLVVYDSFFHSARNVIVPWFADSVWVHIDDIARPNLVAAVPDFDRVIVERIERYAYATDYSAVLRPTLDKLGPAE